MFIKYIIPSISFVVKESKIKSKPMETKKKPKPVVPSQSVKKLRSRPKVPPKPKIPSKSTKIDEFEELPKIPSKSTKTDEFEELDSFLKLLEGGLFF